MSEMIKVIDWRVKIPGSPYSIQHYHHEYCDLGFVNSDTKPDFVNSNIDDRDKNTMLQPLGPAL
jgi:hypothetical protein